MEIGEIIDFVKTEVICSVHHWFRGMDVPVHVGVCVSVCVCVFADTYIRPYMRLYILDMYNCI